MSKIVRTKQKTSKKTLSSPFSIYWDKSNYYILLAGVILSIIGFYLLSIKPWDSTESLYMAPIVLFIAFVIVFPLSILFRKKETEDQ